MGKAHITGGGADGSYPDTHSYLETGIWAWDTAFPWE